MAVLTRVVLDVLKPHHPDIVEFARTLSEHAKGARASVIVEERDEKTESVVVGVEGDNIALEAIVDAIAAMGGSVHSIDEAEAVSEPR